ncbi:cold shock domain-containing protein [Couchioplanes caeruleus]|uniref:cold shock domain-containing protein n=1 Tax=Couchioplanes caeruleus TaxID=56438 RepID=UPI0020BF13E6|nr:cold shock domain-containing protein [Couchioplanes caeruleus]UQU65220.1 cold shock domain-containing protein [Couchioplanes caeruleus]
MAVAGTIREWRDDEGWGVIDSSETPEGCWAHFSAAAVEGFAAFGQGQAVWLEWESPGQDGYAWRATRFWPRDAEPVDRPSQPEAGAAYRSTLTLSFDESAIPEKH